jgi:putative copper export protein
LFVHGTRCLLNFLSLSLIIVLLVMVIIPNYYSDQQVLSQQEGDMSMQMQISGDSEESVTSYIDALIKAPLLVSQSTVVGMVFSQIVLSNTLRTHILLVDSDRSSKIIQKDLRIAKRLVIILMLSVAVLIVSASSLFILQIFNLSTELGLGFIDTFSILIDTSTGTVWLVRIITSIMILIFSTAYFIQIRRDLHSNKLHSNGVSKISHVFLFVILISGSINLMSNSVVSHNAATEFLPWLAVTVDWFHVMGVSIWVGGLFYLSLILLYVIRISSEDMSYGSDSPLEMRKRQIEVRNSYSLAITLPYFSMIAILCLGVIGITGLYMAWLQLQSVGSLFSTTYGNILILKLCVIFPMIALGVYHQIKLHFVMVRTANRGSESLEQQSKNLSNRKQRKDSKVSPDNRGDRYDPFMRFSKTIKIESLIGIAVLTISAFLTITSPPNMIQSDSQMQTSGSGLADNISDSSTEGNEKAVIPEISDGFTIAALVLGIIVLIMSLYYYRQNKQELKTTIHLLKKR